jgi:drug/metabolite transporter (DMT)-like permease
MEGEPNCGTYLLICCRSAILVAGFLDIFTLLFVTSGATLLFHEPLSKQKVIGLIAILVGITLVSRS